MHTFQQIQRAHWHLADCDNGGISNIIECENGGDPLNPADDCTKTDTTDICAILTSNPSSPLADIRL
ncbi:MAG: hypothetical protein IPP01_14025 [Saprospiraceae bacterium]|nr:hypothetical protein [Saprospiraceae bacterium]